MFQNTRLVQLKPVTVCNFVQNMPVVKFKLIYLIIWSTFATTGKLMLWLLCFSKQIFYFTVTKKIWVISCNPSQKHDHNIASTLWRFESPPLDLTILTAKGYSNKLIFWGRTVHCTVYGTLYSTANFKLWECCVQKYVLGPQMLYCSTVLYIEV